MAGPLDELVGRVRRMVEAFAREHELEHAEVRVVLADGREIVVEAVSPEPGYGFLTLTPHRDAGEEPKQVIVPIGAIKVVELSAPDPERPLGFRLEDAPTA
jgi:hypothetical protein